MSPLEDYSDVKYPIDKKALLIQRSLNIQIKDGDVEQQKDNIFHTRCHINNKVCGMIIDSGSCVNVVSVILVRKLNLNTMKYKKPYKLQWLNECCEIIVTKQVLVFFSVGKYQVEILCDMIPIYATYLLLGAS